MVFDFAGNGSCESGRKFPFDSRVRELRGFAIPRHTSQGESVFQFVTQRIVALASRTKQSFSQIQGSERRTNGKMRICRAFWLAMIFLLSRQTSSFFYQLAWDRPPATDCLPHCQCRGEPPNADVVQHSSVS